MARIRTVKPEFWKHEDLSEVPEATHMLACALLNYADDEGYFNANPRLIKGECFPLRELSVKIHGSLIELSRIGYIRLGEASDGKKYGHIINFLDHQKVSHPKPSKINSLDINWVDSENVHGMFSELSVNDAGSLIEASSLNRIELNRIEKNINTNPSFKSKAIPSKKEDDFSEDEKRVLKEKLNNFNIKAKSYETKIVEVLKYYNSLPADEQKKFRIGAINMRDEHMPVPSEGTFEMNLLLIQRYDRQFKNKREAIG